MSLLLRYRECGYRLIRDGVNLRVESDHPLPARTRELLRDHKADILRELAVEVAAAPLNEWQPALVLGRLHLCCNCRHYAWGSDPAGLGHCHRFGLDAAPFTPFYCSRFELAIAPALPALLPPQDDEARHA